MAKNMYCPNCNQYVYAGSFNWVLLILLLVFFFVPGLIYGAYCTFRKKRCPKCGLPLSKKMQPPIEGAE